MTLFYFTMVVCGILGLIGILFKISQESKKDLLEEMFKKNNDINNNTYKKYINKL